MVDYASPDTKKIGFSYIEKEIEEIKDDKVKAIVRENVSKIVDGERDFYL